jgi:TRAP-type C4-dicarboxylate transport system permease small subunit
MKFHSIFNKILEVMLVVLMSVLVLDVLWQVISRYTPFIDPSSFTDELAGYLLIWVSLLGAAYVTGTKEHLAIDLLLQRSPARRKRILSIIIQVCILLFALSVMVTGGIWLMYTRFLLGVKSAALQIPLGFVYIVLPLSGLIIAYYSIYHLIQVIKEK